MNKRIICFEDRYFWTKLSSFFVGSVGLPFGARSPLWYLRLTHTRLADSILELCGVPQKDSLKRLCLRMFTQYTAPAPSCLTCFLPLKRKRSNSRQGEGNVKDRLEKFLSDAVSSHGLPPSAAKNLQLFITNGWMPLPVEITEAIAVIKCAVTALRQAEGGKLPDPRRLKRFEDVGRSLKQLSNLIQLLHSVGVAPLFGSGPKQKVPTLNRPLFISLDLGLRQRRKHFHGQVLFQCIAIPDNYFDRVSTGGDESETNETIISSTGLGSKIAEGGRYDDLVRRYRPPGNFGSALVNYYTTALIPKVSHQAR